MKLDLKEWIAKITGQAEFKKLLWTNPSPTNTFNAQTLLNGVDLTVYDEIEVHGINYTTYGSIMPPIRIPIGGKGNLIGIAGSSGDSSGMGFLVARGVTVNNSSVTIQNAAGVATNGSSWSSNNNNMIPTKIFGIRYVGA